MHPLLTLFQVAMPTVEIGAVFRLAPIGRILGLLQPRRLGANYLFTQFLMLSYLASHIPRVSA
jgi:hypothetical protein